jgi:hypothetical protein
MQGEVAFAPARALQPPRDMPLARVLACITVLAACASPPCHDVDIGGGTLPECRAALAELAGLAPAVSFGTSIADDGTVTPAGVLDLVVSAGGVAGQPQWQDHGAGSPFCPVLGEDAEAQVGGIPMRVTSVGEIVRREAGNAWCEPPTFELEVPAALRTTGVELVLRDHSMELALPLDDLLVPPQLGAVPASWTAGQQVAVTWQAPRSALALTPRVYFLSGVAVPPAGTAVAARVDPAMISISGDELAFTVPALDGQLRMAVALQDAGSGSDHGRFTTAASFVAFADLTVMP